MSEFFISKRTSAFGEEVSVFHVPEAKDKLTLLIPERVIRAQGRVGLFGALSEWTGMLLDHSDPDTTPTESVEPVSAESAISQVATFIESHIPTNPLEISEDLPEELKKAMDSQEEAHIKGIAEGLGIVLPGSEVVDDPDLHIGQYL